MGCGRSWLYDQEQEEARKVEEAAFEKWKSALKPSDIKSLKSAVSDLKDESMSRAGHRAVDQIIAVITY